MSAFITVRAFTLSSACVQPCSSALLHARRVARPRASPPTWSEAATRVVLHTLVSAWCAPRVRVYRATSIDVSLRVRAIARYPTSHPTGFRAWRFVAYRARSSAVVPADSLAWATMRRQALIYAGSHAGRLVVATVDVDAACDTSVQVGHRVMHQFPPNLRDFDETSSTCESISSP